MKKIYLFQNIHSLSIYNFDLCHYDARQDYRMVCEQIFATNADFSHSNQEYYALLTYVLCSFSGYNKKHREYKEVKDAIYGLFGESFIKDIRKTFADKFVYLGRTATLFNF